jgi:hypothetical protein
VTYFRIKLIFYVVLQITGSVRAEGSTLQIKTGKYNELLKDHLKIYAKKYFNKTGFSIGERTKMG